MPYAWAPIKAGEKKFKYGDSVSAGDLEVSDDDFQALLDSGAVREAEPPKLPKSWQGSPLDYVKEQRAKETDEDLLVSTGGSTFTPSAEDVLLGGFEGNTAEEYEEHLQKMHEEKVKAAEKEEKEAEKEEPAKPKAAQAKSGSSGS